MSRKFGDGLPERFWHEPPDGRAPRRAAIAALTTIAVLGAVVLLVAIAALVIQTLRHAR